MDVSAFGPSRPKILNRYVSLPENGFQPPPQVYRQDVLGMVGGLAVGCRVSREPAAWRLNSKASFLSVLVIHALRQFPNVQIGTMFRQRSPSDCVTAMIRYRSSSFLLFFAPS